MKMILLLTMLMSDGIAVGTKPQMDVVLLDFTAGYCQPCQQMMPLMQTMERDGFPIQKIDVSKEPELARQFSVDRLPTFVLLVEGKEVDRFVGLTSEAELRQKMNDAARKLAESRRAAAVPTADESGLRTGNNAKSVSLPEQPQAAASPRSVRDVIGGFLSRNGRPSGAENTTLRGQSPEPASSRLTGLAAASAATVRVTVTGVSTKDGRKLRDAGTGTIVYSAETEATVLTCAHLFLNIASDSSEVQVEVFHDGTVTPFTARVLGGDHDADLAFLRISTAERLPSIHLTQLEPEVRQNQTLVSYGCNEGATHSRLDTKVVDINRYKGPDNLVCATDPESGRSGGGLFNENGELVGVCSCADRDQKEGLYMAYAPILSLIDRLKLQSILQPTTVNTGDDAEEMFQDLLEGRTDSLAGNRKQVAADVPIPHGDVADHDASPFEDDSLQPTSEIVRTSVALHEPGSLSDARLFQTADAGSATATSSRPKAVAGNAAIGPKVTITIDDNTPGAQAKVIVIPQASPWLLELLTGESYFETEAPKGLTPIQRVINAKE